MKELFKALDTIRFSTTSVQLTVVDLKNELTASKTHCTKLEMHIDQLLDRVANLERKNADLESQLSEAKVHADNLKIELDKRIEQDGRVLSEMDEARNALGDLATRADTAEAEAARFKKEADAANEKIAKLELAPPAPPNPPGMRLNEFDPVPGPANNTSQLHAELDELSAEAPRSAEYTKGYWAGRKFGTELGYKLGYNEGFEQARGDLKELLRAMTACPPARSGE